MLELSLKDVEMNENTTLLEFFSNRGKSSNLINRRLISDLFSIGSIKEIESGVVKYFLIKNNISTIRNNLILEVLDNDNNKIVNFLRRLNIGMTLSDLEKIFELLIDIKDKRINGAVYTPSFIVNYIVDNVIKEEGLVCDCSCGSGAFLLGALKRLREITKKSIIDLIENNIYGVDILDYSVRRAKIILSLFAIINGYDKANLKFNIKVADSLKADWKKLFPDVFKEKDGFDFVIGNPPYVRIQDLTESLRQTLIEKWETIKIGSYNLYFAFFEFGMQILNKSGGLGYITPNNYFTSLAGIELRGYFSDNKKITRILNFNHLKLFENAQTYTCIAFMDKDYNKDYFEYYYLKDKKEILDGLDKVRFSKYYYKWLNNKKWRLMAEKDYNNIKIIENLGVPLGKLCSIRVGVATLKDVVFFVLRYDDRYCKAFFKNKEFLVEKEITRKIIKISSIKDEQEIPTDNRMIIFPYLKKNGKYVVMSEDFMKENYPLCYKYLKFAKEELYKRDKGKQSYPVWFAWGRTQGMNYKGHRLYTRTFSDKPNFMFDMSDDNLFCNGYAVFCEEHTRAIQKILNSRVMDYYVKKTSLEIEGNYQCYQKNFIEKFNIPSLTEEEWIYLEGENDKNKINLWLINKYHLKV